METLRCALNGVHSIKLYILATQLINYRVCMDVAKNKAEKKVSISQLFENYIVWLIYRYTCCDITQSGIKSYELLVVYHTRYLIRQQFNMHNTLTISKSLIKGKFFLAFSSVTCSRISCSLSWALWQMSSSKRRVISVLTAKKGVFCSTIPATQTQSYKWSDVYIIVQKNEALLCKTLRV